MKRISLLLVLFASLNAYAMSDEEYQAYFKCLNAINEPLEGERETQVQGFQRFAAGDQTGGPAFINTRITGEGILRKVHLHVYTPKGVRHHVIPATKKGKFGIQGQDGVVAKVAIGAGDADRGPTVVVVKHPPRQEYDEVLEGDAFKGDPADSILVNRVRKQVLLLEQRYRRDVAEAEDRVRGLDGAAREIASSRGQKDFLEFDLYPQRVSACADVPDETVKKEVFRLRTTLFPVRGDVIVEKPTVTRVPAAKSKKAAR
jgi:hypothetical protein